MVNREHARLRAAFRRILLVTLALEGCTTHGGVEGEADASAGDATIGADDASSDAAGTSDAPRDPCAPRPYAPPPGSVPPSDAGDAGDGGDGGDPCAELYRLECGLPAGVTPHADCYFLLDDCNRFCGDIFFNCHAWDDSCVDGSVPEGGPITVDCVTCPNGVGRRPRGLVDRAERGGGDGDVRLDESALGRWFAEVARLEAASIRAFRDLRDELDAHGAPAALVAEAERAMRDEARHAKLTGRIARRFGGRPRTPRVRRGDRGATRSLEALAIVNAVEGCVREAYGALVATWQAARAADPEVARVMSEIAEDETRHAALAWAVARWIEPRLGPAAAARVIDARTRAARALADEVAAGPIAASVTRTGGVPPAHRQARLAAAFATEVLV